MYYFEIWFTFYDALTWWEKDTFLHGSPYQKNLMTKDGNGTISKSLFDSPSFYNLKMIVHWNKNDPLEIIPPHCEISVVG